MTACGRTGPTFQEITEVRIRNQDQHGLAERVLTAEQLERAKTCLGTIQVSSADKVDEQLLRASLLIEITDARGLRSFEMFSEHDLKGRDDRYYRSNCLHALVEAAGSSETRNPGDAPRGR